MINLLGGLKIKYKMNIKNVKYINKFLRLPYPKNQMLIIGSAVMALFGLKVNKDLDIWTTPFVEKMISRDKNYTVKKSKMDGSNMYHHKDGSLEFVITLPKHRGDFKKALEKSIMIYGIHFQHPKDLLAWKKEVRRPKDKDDIKKLEIFLKKKLIENYLETIQNLK